MPVLAPQMLIAERVDAIQAFHVSFRVPRAELDVSGGVDSAVVLGLLAQALGPENVTAVYQGIHSNPASLERAREAASAFSVALIEFDGTVLFETLVQQMTDALVAVGYDKGTILQRLETDPTVKGSIRSTLRAPWGRAANRLTGDGIRHGTGNEDEDRILRFYQKGGDGEVDTNPIAMLSKGEVYQLAMALGVPESIIKARPSPDLWGSGDAHNDEDEIASYLGLSGCTHPFYSYVRDDGTYRNVGLIERLSRWADLFTSERTWGEELFGDYHSALPACIKHAQGSRQFKTVDPEVVATLLTNARRVEAGTRHKMNPNCPTLGSRKELVQAGILTNNLPTE